MKQQYLILFFAKNYEDMSVSNLSLFFLDENNLTEEALLDIFKKNFNNFVEIENKDIKEDADKAQKWCTPEQYDSYIKSIKTPFQWFNYLLKTTLDGAGSGCNFEYLEQNGYNWRPYDDIPITKIIQFYNVDYFCDGDKDHPFDCEVIECQKPRAPR